MPEIILSTLNAKYIHAAFGLRYLMANLGDLQSRAAILEFTIQDRPIDIAERILAGSPTIVGLGVYIWNVTETTRLVELLKQIRPEIVIILGGPEVSYEWEAQRVVHRADYLITGEADLRFRAVCAQVLQGSPPSEKVIPAPLPHPSELQSPYECYTDQDVAHRIIYVEASRGCPFTCEFCLSSLDIPVRQFDLDAFLADLESLLTRGVRQFKFVDRTFNLNLRIGQRILRFFLERYEPGLFIHFEMIPDRLPTGLREVIAEFPPGTLQFEIGIQSLNDAVSGHISRRQDVAKIRDNLRFLRDETGVHVHADLIAGLPGEDEDSFARGFNDLLAMGPQEIQLGILKRLRGTPIVRHDETFDMVYSPDPPYEILRTKDLSFESLQRLRRLARFWDLVANSGNFIDSTPLIWKDDPSPYHSLARCSEWLYEQVGSYQGIALTRLVGLLFAYLTTEKNLAPEPTAQTLLHDYQRAGRSDVPKPLRPHIAGAGAGTGRGSPAAPTASLPKRQARFAAQGVSHP